MSLLSLAYLHWIIDPVRRMMEGRRIGIDTWPEKDASIKPFILKIMNGGDFETVDKESIDTTQIFVPTLEENMLDKSKFHCMLNWSHIAAAVFKALFGYIGFVTFQEDTQEEVRDLI